MAAEIQKQLGVEPGLVPGSGGVFDVFANGLLVFSKHQEDNQFPERQLVVDRLIKMRQGDEDSATA